MKIGFIGLGTMGLPMATNLLKHGFEMKAYDVVDERIRLVVGRGAAPASSPKAASEGSDVVMTSLPRSEISEQVVLGKNGVLEGAPKGSVMIELSTVTPATVLKMGEKARMKGIEVLDAPVSGGLVGAERGNLTIMVGGSLEVFEKCLPVFNAIGKRAYYVGELGSGEAIKLLNSVLAVSNFMIARETLRLVISSDIDPEVAHEVINSSTGQSWMWSNWVKAAIQNKTVGSTLEILFKDVSYALLMARESKTNVPIVEEVLASIEEWSKSEGKAGDVSLMLSYLQGKRQGPRWRSGAADRS